MLIYSRGAFVNRVAHTFFCSKWSFRNRYKCSYIKTIWYWTDSCVGRKLVATSAGEGWLTVMASKDETASKDDKGIGWREDKADMRLGNYTISKRPVRAVQRRIPQKHVCLSCGLVWDWIGQEEFSDEVSFEAFIDFLRISYEFRGAVLKFPLKFSRVLVLSDRTK